MDRRKVLAGMAALLAWPITPVGASTVDALPGLEMEWDYYMRGGTPILGALDSRFKFGAFRPDRTK